MSKGFEPQTSKRGVNPDIPILTKDKFKESATYGIARCLHMRPSDGILLK
jgi:hypothetical protein